MKAKITRKKVYDNLFACLLVAYPLFHFAMFWVYVNFGTIANTFMKFSVYTGEYEWAGFYNYSRVFKLMILGEDAALTRAFWNSFQAIGINVIILPIAVFSAYAFYKKMPGTGFYSVMFYIP